MHQFTASHIEDSLSLFRYYKKLSERALEQISDAELFVSLDEEMNSIAVIMKHMAGNMRSRWTDFLESDGEKPDRNRDSEFLDPPGGRVELMAMWDDGWRRLFQALEGLKDPDLPRPVMIRGEPHSVLQAINRQLAHYAYHCGQIVFLAKHLRGNEWQSLTIPRKGSAEFNRRVLRGEASQR